MSISSSSASSASVYPRRVYSPAYQVQRLGDLLLNAQLDLQGQLLPQLDRRGVQIHPMRGIVLLPVAPWERYAWRAPGSDWATHVLLKSPGHGGVEVLSEVRIAWTARSTPHLKSR